MNEDRVAGAAKQVGGKIEEAAGGILGDAKLKGQGKVDGITGSVQNALGGAKEAISEVADQASGVAGDVYERGRRYVEEGRQRYPEAERAYRDGAAAVRGQVQEAPLLALVTAGAVGFLLALLVTRRD